MKPELEPRKRGIQSLADCAFERFRADALDKSRADLFKKIAEQIYRRAKLSCSLRCEKIGLAAQGIRKRAVPARMGRHAPRLLFQNRKQVIQHRHQPAVAVPGQTERKNKRSEMIAAVKIRSLEVDAGAVDSVLAVRGIKQNRGRNGAELLRLLQQFPDDGPL